VSRQGVEYLVDRWINDPAFREKFRQDPGEVVRHCPFALNAEEWAALRSIDWTLPDEELQARASKMIQG
jgi:hypothetical protein